MAFVIYATVNEVYVFCLELHHIMIWVYFCIVLSSMYNGPSLIFMPQSLTGWYLQLRLTSSMIAMFFYEDLGLIEIIIPGHTLCMSVSHVQTIYKSKPHPLPQNRYAILRGPALWFLALVHDLHLMSWLVLYIGVSRCFHKSASIFGLNASVCSDMICEISHYSSSKFPEDNHYSWENVSSHWSVTACKVQCWKCCWKRYANTIIWTSSVWQR